MRVRLFDKFGQTRLFTFKSAGRQSGDVTPAIPGERRRGRMSRPAALVPALLFVLGHFLMSVVVSYPF